MDDPQACRRIVELVESFEHYPVADHASDFGSLSPAHDTSECCGVFTLGLSRFCQSFHMTLQYRDLFAMTFSFFEEIADWSVICWH